MRRGERTIFTFQGDVEELVKAISKITCKNFILTQKIRSQKMEILTSTPIGPGEIWRAFLSALEANDITVSRAGNYYKLVQSAEAYRTTAPVFDEEAQIPLDERFITKVVRLKHGGDVDQAVNYLNQFKSARAGQIFPHKPSNTIIITDFASMVDRLLRILDEIDQPGALEQVHVVPVQFASASEVAEKLNQIFQPDQAGTQTRTTRRSSGARARSGQDNQAQTKEGAGASDPEESTAASVSKILADDRTNKLIIIASEQALGQILSLMRELDVPEDSTQGQIHVLRLSHADAEELSSTLASLAQNQQQNLQPGRRRAAGQQQQTPTSPSAAALFQGEVRVTADAATNSLVITASKADFSSMQRVIEKLDVPRFQVFVEAVIMEVSTNNDRTLGVGWHGGVSPTIGGEESPIVLSNTPTADLSSLAISQNPLGLASLLGLAGALRGPTLDGTEDIVQGGIPAIGVVIQALQGQNDVNVISTPHLLTIDNEEAEIQVNEQRPFPSGLTLGGLGGLQQGDTNLPVGSLGLNAVNFNREDVGLTLKLRPQINDEDFVRLEIEQELSDVAGIDQVTGQVITSNRSAQTVVVVRNQDSVVIGGLVRDRETQDESKLPLFGDIPLIGWLFKRQQKTVEKTNLLLIITPYIIRGPKDFEAIFRRKMEERREFVNRFYGTSVEYRAAIDWDRKMGPLANYRQSMQTELRRAENDGPGLPDETIIRPAEPFDTGVLEPPFPEDGGYTVPPPDEGSEGPVPPPPLPNDD
ncbi:MAG: type II secretion system secretin GspD [Myxococcota bacterium]